MSDEAGGGGLRARGEEALGDLAQAQRTAMGALNIPAASELERLEQRLRSLSNRLESVEDRLDDLSDEVAALRRRLSALEPSSGEGDERLSVPERGQP